MRFFVFMMLIALALFGMALAGKGEADGESVKHVKVHKVKGEADGESMKVHKVKKTKGEADGESSKHMKKGKHAAGEA